MGLTKDTFNAIYSFLRDRKVLLGSCDVQPLVVRQCAVGKQKELIFKRLANSDGATNMNVDGSVNPVEFFIQPPDGEIWRIAKWMLYVCDEKGFDVVTWGSGLTLTNGIELKVTIDGVTKNLLDFNIKTSGDVESLAFDCNLKTYGNDDDVLVANWNLTDTGQFIRLDGSNNDRLSVIINDDLTDLTAQYIQVQGYKE